VKTNQRSQATRPETHEGAGARIINPTQQLERTLNACLLFEKTFYEDGESVADRLYNCVEAVEPVIAGRLAIRARNKLYLRHAPLLVVVAMADSPKHSFLVEDILGGWGTPGTEGYTRGVIARPDELGEFLSLYWLYGKQLTGNEKRPISACIKRGLAKAIKQFDAYQLGKWKGSSKTAITLRDVLRLVHPTPDTPEQAGWFKGLVDGTLEAPDTWEVALSAGADKAATFIRLMREDKLPAMAFLMNLRNMVEAGVSGMAISEYCDTLRFARVLPTRFITAEKFAPSVSDALDRAMMRVFEESAKLPGKTIILVDVSDSMNAALSEKGFGTIRAAAHETSRMDAACGLAIHAREVCEEARVFTFSNDLVEVPNRRGFGLRDAIVSSQPHGMTAMDDAVKAINKAGAYDRLIIITDEQNRDTLPNPNQGTKGYVLNVSSEKNGVGYHPWTNITGYSPHVIKFAMAHEGVTQGARIKEVEQTDDAPRIV